MTVEAPARSANILDALKHASASDIGLRREENQDSFGAIIAPAFHFYFVADGMGGVKGGAVASRLAVKTLGECLESRERVDEEEIRSAVYNANHEIFERGVDDAQLAGMGTTLVGLLFNERGMFVVNVGDSRAYRIRRGQAKQLTEDHTLVMELLKSGAISREQVENHPVSHMLTRSLGPTPVIEPDCWLDANGPARGDKYLLCSDGLYNLVPARDIAAVLEGRDLESAANELIRLANERGGTDNITVILIEVGDQFIRAPDEFPEESEAPSAAVKRRSEVDGERSAASQDTGAASEQGGGAFYKPEGRGDSSPSIDSSAKTAEFEFSAEQAESAASSAAHGSRGPLAYAALGALIATGIFMGYGLLKSGDESALPRLVKLDSSDPSEVIAPRVKQGELADLQIPAKARLSTPAAPQSLLPPLSRATIDRGADGGGFLTQDESKSVRHRVLEVSAYVQSLQDKIDALNQPIRGRSGEVLKETQVALEEQTRRLEEVRSRIEVATRRLSIWFGRRKRLESSDPINLATEVSVSSPAVKEKREIFERSSWEYLKEYEVLRYNPSDSAQERKVNELARLRKTRMKELIEEVRNTIDSEITAADKSIADLTGEREAIQSKIDSLKREAEYQQTLIGGSLEAKERKKAELSEELSARKSELEELRHLYESGSTRGAESR